MQKREWKKLHRSKKIFILCSILLLMALAIAPGIRALMQIPSEVTQFEGDEQTMDFGLPWGININDTNGILRLAEEVGEGFILSAEEAGKYHFTFNLFGIPLKRMQVNVIPSIELAPSGHSIGVKLSDHGVIIAGLDGVQTNSGKIEPAKDSGFEVGDILESVNGIKLKSLEHAAAVLEEQSQPGRELNCGVIRNGRRLTLKVTPALDQQTNKYRLGLLLKDTAAGVGTMTFYHPETGIYGALGHMIADGSGGNAIDLSSGTIVDAQIISIQKGQRGNPGEKKGVFNTDSESLGNIHANTELGIFGRLSRKPDFEFDTLPLGFKHQVKTGAAEILTVVEGEKIERFKIEIEKVFIQNLPASKGMVIKVTDPRLLEATGGIVQGMSGSPIIQNGRIVGAVTHVFINEPHRGYGCFAEWMVTESGLLEEIESTVPPMLLEAFFLSIFVELSDFLTHSFSLILSI